MKHHIWDDSAHEDAALADLGVTLAAMALAVVLACVLAIAWGCSPPYPPAAHAQGGRERPRAASQALLPRVQGGGRVSVPPTATAAPRPSQTPLRPSTEADIRRTISQSGAVVDPSPGEYLMTQYGYLGSGTTLDGHGQVSLKGRGLIVDGQRDVTIRGIGIKGSPKDGLSILRSTNVLVENVRIEGSGDGGLDVIHAQLGGSVVVVRNSVLVGHKNALVGHPFDGLDRGILVAFNNVTFDGYSRPPKVHYATAQVNGGRVVNFYSGWDVQKGGRLTVKGTYVCSRPGAKWLTANDGTATIALSGLTFCAESVR